jgi:diguanylate cyclase (GGDEF)-like protein
MQGNAAARPQAHEAPASETAAQRESERLAALEGLDILDTPREEAFDRITRLTKKIFDVPVAIVSFIDGHRQWYKASEGAGVEEVPREESFCRHVICDGETLVVPDATKDSRFDANPHVVRRNGVRFYAGLPLTTRSGQNVGSLCITDFKPRSFDPGQVGIMNDLARMVMDELELRVSASHDSLTGVLSRRAFKDKAAKACALASRHGHPLSVIAIDVDHFKLVNDTYGHAAGDRVLTAVGATCLAQLRHTDFCGRLGGEEFAAVLPNTPAPGALAVAEKMRSAIERHIVEVEAFAIGVTASFGVAALDASTADADALLDAADKALYDAKAAGRNCIVVRQPAKAVASPMRKVLKAGRILFNGRTSSIDCTVRKLSDEGAALDVSSSVGVPKEFDLAIAADRLLKPCVAMKRSERHIEVAFR